MPVTDIENGPPTIIVNIGAEGGHITLCWERTGGVSWRFRRSLAGTFLSRRRGLPEIRETSEWVGSWPEALNLLRRLSLADPLPLRGSSRVRRPDLGGVTGRLVGKTDSWELEALQCWQQFCHEPPFGARDGKLHRLPSVIRRYARHRYSISSSDPVHPRYRCFR